MPICTCNTPVLGAPASIIGSELSGLFGSDPSLCPAPMALGRLDRDYAELRRDGVLGSCAGLCNPSYLAALRNTAGPKGPALS
jgi:hypothetical protein